MYASGECEDWKTHLWLARHLKLEDTNSKARYHYVHRSDGVYLEVVNHESYVVNLEERTCSWGCWQAYNLPCKHACAMILLNDWMSTATLMATLRPSHTGVLGGSHLPDTRHWQASSRWRRHSIQPPMIKRRPSQPCHRRIEPWRNKFANYDSKSNVLVEL